MENNKDSPKNDNTVSADEKPPRLEDLLARYYDNGVVLKVYNIGKNHYLKPNCSLV